jgi:hypothetical protein
MNEFALVKINFGLCIWNRISFKCMDIISVDNQATMQCVKSSRLYSTTSTVALSLKTRLFINRDLVSGL